MATYLRGADGLSVFLDKRKKVVDNLLDLFLQRGRFDSFDRFPSFGLRPVARRRLKIIRSVNVSTPIYSSIPYPLTADALGSIANALQRPLFAQFRPFPSAARVVQYLVFDRIDPFQILEALLNSYSV